MRAVVLDFPASALAERRALGLDHRDEMWEGVLHVVPPPSAGHQSLGTALIVVIAPVAADRGMKMTYETGFFHPPDPARDYRVPDLIVARTEHWTERGVEGGAVLVVEILSPGDESFDKLPFYAEHGAEQVLFIDPVTFSMELRRLVDGAYEVVDPGGGPVVIEHLDLALRTLDGPAPNGPALEATGPGGSQEIRL